MKVTTITIKKLLLSIIVPVIAGAIGLLLLALVFCIPTEQIYKNVEKSAQTLVAETINDGAYYFSVTPNVAGSSVDSYTEALYLNGALVNTKNESLLKCILSGYCYAEKDTINPIKDLSGLFTNKNNNSKLFPISERFFNGYLIPLKIMLVLTDYSGIRQINIFMMLFLFVLLCKLMYKRGLSKYVIPTLISILFINPLTVAITMSFVGFYYCMVIPCIVMLTMKKETLKKYAWLIFELTGVCAFFFNMNYFQLLTFTMPFMFYLLLCGFPEDYKKIFDIVISLFVFWFIGYAGMMIFKWIVYAITLNPDIFNKMLANIFFRTSTTSDGTRIYGILKNFNIGRSNKWWDLTELIFIIYTFINYAKNNVKLHIKKSEILLLFIMTIIPILRYFVFSNHVIIHGWVMYRLLMAPIMAFNIAIVRIGENNEPIEL